MINGKINKGNVQVSVNGNAPTLAAEVCCLIRAMYKSIADESNVSAEKFKEIIVDEINGDRMFSDKLDDNEKLFIDDGNDDNEKPDVPDLDKLKQVLERLRKLKGMLEDED